MSDDRARAVAQTLIDCEGTAGASSLQLEDAEEGYAPVAMTVLANMLNGHGSVHGGMIFALADSASAYACNSRDVATVAQGASIIFLTPARLGNRLVADARETMLVGRAGSYAVDVRTEDGRPIATFQGLSRNVGGSVLELEEHT